MEKIKLSKLNDQELLNEHKKLKNNIITNASLIGLLIGIALYSLVKNGFVFFTFFPLFFVLILVYTNKKSKTNEKIANCKKELISRNLK